jgi:hypothetical protein
VALGQVSLQTILFSTASYLFLFYLFTFTANGFLTGGSGTTIRHNTQITHHPQTKHITQNYTNNEGHTTHSEYTANTITTAINTITTTNYNYNYNSYHSINASYSSVIRVGTIGPFETSVPLQEQKEKS